MNHKTQISMECDCDPDTALTRLMKSERDDMLRYACFRLGNMPDAEDTVQDVYIRLRASPHHLPTKQLRNYLYRSLSNLCTDRLRRNSRQCFVSLEQASHIVNTDINARTFEQEFHRINLLLNELPDEQAEVIRLRLHGNKSFSEISEIQNIPLTTAKSRFQYGIEKLRKVLQN